MLWVRICALLSAAAAWGAMASIDPGEYIAEVKYLASPELRGRGTGMPELDQAAEHIAARFRSFGLQPVEAGRYYQAFNVTTNAQLGAGNRFTWSDGGTPHTLTFQEEFIPFNFSAAGSLEGALVFAGYGITAPEYHYDDYAGLDVKGRIVVVLRHEPQEYDDKSVFSGRVYTEHAQFFSKAANAKMHGATGVILVADRANHTGDGDPLESFARTVGPADAGIPFVQVRAAVADQWFALAGKKLDDVERSIDLDPGPRSFAFPETLRVSAKLDLERATRTVRNVAAYLPGQTDEYIVLGAHYDHLGLGEQFSLAPSLAGTVHPGADDNASGTAGMIALARWFSTRPKPRRGILFLAFAGEELGLLGSSFYVNHPELPIENAAAMINLDMIGRVREGKVFVGGVGTGTMLKTVLQEAAAKSPLHLEYSDAGGYGSSDHTSFTTRQVPVLFFFSGLHGDYHKPSDTWEKIDGPETVKLLSLVSDVATRLVESPGRPAYIRVPPPAGAVSGSGSGYGAYFGSIPDFGEGVKGVKFADVREGSPAASAGLRAGDILVEFDGKPVQNLYDFTYVLRARKPGDKVTVKVLRAGREVKARVTLGKRS